MDGVDKVRIDKRSHVAGRRWHLVDGVDKARMHLAGRKVCEGKRGGSL